MNPRRRRQQKALVREMRQGGSEDVLEVLEPEALTPIVEVPVVLEPVISEAEVRMQENLASEQGVELEVVVGEEPMTSEDIEISIVDEESAGE